MPEAPRHLVFTDLDGTLLDHHDYGYQPAMPRLRQLALENIPLIIATSKTRAEIEPLRRALGNRHPFICENGAAVCIPSGYFPSQPEGTRVDGVWWLREFSPPREHWLTLLQALAPEFSGEFTSFSQAGIEGISAMTGLGPEAAALANQRQYSEPVQWLGGSERRELFLARLREHGATVLQGGRFLGVTGDCDKGRALAWLRAIYSLDASGQLSDLAAGDSGNDVPMLELAGTALLVRSPVHEFPELRRSGGVIRSNHSGPAGWSEGVAAWLRLQGIDEQQSED